MNGRAALGRWVLAALMSSAAGAFPVDGSFDPTWAGGGRIAFNGDNKNAGANSAAFHIAVTPDGGFLVGGSAATSGSAGGYWWLGELSAAGQLVNTFGAADGSGRITECQLGFICASNFDTYGTHLLQADGKALVLSQALYRTNAGGNALDTAGVVGATGHVATQFTINNAGGTVTVNGAAIAPGPNGTLYAAGAGKYKSATSYTSFGIVRLNPDLSLDTTFNATIDGLGVTFAGGQYIDVGDKAEVTALAVQSGGGVVLVGIYNQSPNFSIGLARLNPDGSSDSSYGVSGVRKLGDYDASAGQYLSLYSPSIAIDRADNLYIAITAAVLSTSTEGMLATRIDSIGTQATDFGASGWAFNYNFPACPNDNVTANAIAIDSAGRLVVAGGCDGEFGVERLRGDMGTLDTSFGFGGFSHGNFAAASNSDIAFAIVFDHGGRPVLAGSTFPAIIQQEVGVARLTYDLIYTNNFEIAPRGCLPPDCD